MDKIWSIKFNKAIDGYSILDNIKVEDSKGNIVKTTVEVDDNIVEVNLAVDGYKSEGTYILRGLDIE